jgi:hypothetical protein
MTDPYGRAPGPGTSGDRSTFLWLAGTIAAAVITGAFGLWAALIKPDDSADGVPRPGTSSSAPVRAAGPALAQPPSGEDPEETEEPTPGDGYELEHENIPLAIRTAGACGPYLAIDFDGDPTGMNGPITRRVTNESDLGSDELASIDMKYVTCSEGELLVSEGAAVGLLRKGEGDGPETCAAAASGASIGGSLNITKDNKPADAGFEEGASLCAVTAKGRLARATITKIVYNSGISNRIPSVEFKLTTWT